MRHRVVTTVDIVIQKRNQDDPHMTPASDPQSGTVLAAGMPAPDFELHATPDETLRLSELRGRPVILAFYPADWSPVCGDQLALYNELIEEFGEYDAQLVGISVDGVWCHAAYTKQRGLRFPLLSDFEPKGAVARQYGAYREAEGVSERALFVLDGEGNIRWSHLSPPGVNPGADGILRALESMAGRETGVGARPAPQQSQEARP